MSEAVDLRAFIRSVPDFPQPGVLFRDITPLLRDPAAFKASVDWYCAQVRELSPDAVVGIESRGFLFGTPVAALLSLPFVPIRKPGKLPAPRMSIEYSLEYGESQLDIQADALEPGASVAIIDDVLATGGTAIGAAKLVELIGARVKGFVFLIELAGLGARERVQYPLRSCIRYE
jgi:adenine phosphoribosyltransferase